MADLAVCNRCGETEDCLCVNFGGARRNVKKSREKMFFDLGHLLANLIERMPERCPSCEAARKTNPATECKLCSDVRYLKGRVAEARSA